MPLDECKSHREDRRFRELYRYFQPSNPAALLYSPFADAADATPGNPGPSLAIGLPAQDLSSANTILTTFAQTATLKLNTDRAIISIVDRDTEYLLAEASRTGNLRDASKNIFSDTWMAAGGFGPLLNAKTTSLSVPPKDKYAFHIVNDLSAEEQYSSLPFVSGPPHYRFYAGTPLVTENKIHLGAFAVFDTNSRNGLTEIEKDELGYLANLTMDFLRLSRQGAEGRRAARLSRGLSCFVEGSSSFVDGLNSFGSSSTPDNSTLSSTPPPAETSPIARSRGSHGSRESRHSRGSSTDVRPTRSPPSSEGLDTGTSSDLTNPLPEWLAANTKGSKSRLADEMHTHNWTFRRAANLIRESLELSGDSGVAFLENSNTPLDVDNGRLEFVDDNESPAPVLGVSTSDEPFSSSPGGEPPAISNFDRRFLQSVFRRYPKGKIWTFHRDRSLFSSSDEDENNPSSPVSAVRVQPDTLPTSRKKWQATETSQLSKYFPSASQVLFVPLWNAATSQWFAGCFCWNSNETRVFNASVELTSIMGFGYSIMAELSRLESIIADRQKGDFIGSISHELRSPLHGILAAAEFMDSTHMNEFQKSLLETVNACGRTLLDTMNQVLDFSKIVSLEKSWRQMKKARRDRKDDLPDNVQGIDSMASLLDMHTSEDICLLTEEVVEGVCIGHSYSRSLAQNTSSPSYVSAPSSRSGSSSLSTPDSDSTGDGRSSQVDVIVDIEEGDWVYRTQPGALRRIVMNIFGNAMKYTDSGHVIIRLETLKGNASSKVKLGKESDELITITVTDTGKGISEDFLRARLYMPFSQEDTLAVGTGLGLAIVQSLVKSLCGHISIRSQPGEGTRVKVTLPLSRPTAEEAGSPPLRANQSTLSRDLRFIRERFPEKSVAIVGYDPAMSSNTGISIVFARYITEWFGLTLQPWPPQGPVDLVLAQDSDVTNEFKTKAMRPLALLVFCSGPEALDPVRTTWSRLANVVEYVYRPCGPHKLARIIFQCLQKSSSSPTRHAGIQHSRLADRTRIHFSGSKSDLQSEVVSIGGSSFDESSMPSLEGVRTGSDSQVTTASTLGSPVDEQPLEGSNDEGILGRHSAPASTANADEIPLLPKDQDLTLSPATPINVLVVDDNQINLRLLTTYLGRRNVANLDTAENGKMAVDAVEKRAEGYDIIFMDISMPVMNGFEATRAIRALENERDERRPATIIALTGLSSARDETEALTSGVDLFLTKPVSLKEVSRLLEEWEPKQPC